MRSTRPSSASTRSERGELRLLSSPGAGLPVTAALRLEPRELSLQRQPGPLLPQIRAALAAEGEPLRWAITGVDGLQLRIEAMVLLRS